MKKLLYILTIFFLVGCSKTNKLQDTVETELVMEKRDNGELYLIGHKKGDQKVGEWRIFRKDRLFSVLNYHEGVQHGKEISYESCTGKVLEEGYFDMGKRVGLWYFYTDGELVAVTEHKNDISEIVYHNPKFKNAGEVPPPPSYGSSDCDEHKDY